MCVYTYKYEIKAKIHFQKRKMRSIVSGKLDGSCQF